MPSSANRAIEAGKSYLLSDSYLVQSASKAPSPLRIEDRQSGVLCPYSDEGKDFAFVVDTVVEDGQIHVIRVRLAPDEDPVWEANLNPYFSPIERWRHDWLLRSPLGDLAEWPDWMYSRFCSLWPETDG